MCILMFAVAMRRSCDVRAMTSVGRRVFCTKNEEKKMSYSDIAKTGGIGSTMGLLGGMVGIGGGVVGIPLMTSILPLSQHQAHGTSLAAVTATGIVGASTFYLYGNGSIDFMAASIIAPSAALSSNIGVRICNKASGKQLKYLLALLTFSSAIASGWKEYKMRSMQIKDELSEDNPENLETLEGQKEEQIPTTQNNEPNTTIEAMKFAVIGVTTGMVSGLLGVGGGVVLLPLLTFATDMSQTLIVGTVLTCLIPVTIVGTISHSRAGNVVWRKLPALLIGSSVGAYLGSRLAIWMTETQQRGVVIGVMTCVGLKCLL